MLILGGSAFQVPAILHAVKLGHHVITCDYLPENPGHRYAHEYYNVSTTDAGAVVALGRELAIDGVLAFASDPAASTAAYVTSVLKLPGCPPQAIHRLTNKAAFRAHLREHGFKIPDFAAAATLDDAQRLAQTIGFPVMVKPCDSSGSKGVSRVVSGAEMSTAFQFALGYLRCSRVIVEQWLGRTGAQIAGDGLVVDGQVVFGCFGDEHFDLECCAHAPVGESFPGMLAETRRTELFEQLQRLFSTLGIRNLVFNLDAMIDSVGDLVIIEIGPRAGGNCLPRVIHNHTGVDLMDIAIHQAVGAEISPHSYLATPKGFHASWMIHSRFDGHLCGFQVAPDVAPHVREVALFAKPGTAVRKFASSSDTLGYAILSFPSGAAMADSLWHMGTSIHPVLA